VLIAHGATDEERLVVLASLAAPRDQETAELTALAERVDWAEVVALAELNAVIPMLHRQLRRAGQLPRVPAGARSAMLHTSAAVALANERRTAAATGLLHRFHAAGIQCVVLKGMLFANQIYHDPHYKRMNDLDILIRVTDAPAAMAVYRDLGMFSPRDLLGGHVTVDPERSHHLPSFVSADGALVVGTHWGLITPRAPLHVDHARIWSRVRPVDLWGAPAWAMAPEDNLHHLCIHLPLYKNGVRELADIWNLLRHHGADFDPDLVIAAMHAAGSPGPVCHALTLSQRLVPDDAGAAVLAAAAAAAPRPYRRAAARRSQNVHALLRCRSTHTSRIEKAYTRFNTTDDLHEKFTAFTELWRALLLPPAPEAVKLGSLHRPAPRAAMQARLAAPYRLSRVFRRDLGGWLFVAALVKTVTDLVWAGVRTLAGHRGTRTLSGFAAAAGLSVDELTAILESQE